MSMMRAYAVALASLLAGAAVVHAVYKPDLVSGGWCLSFLSVARRNALDTDRSSRRPIRTSHRQTLPVGDDAAEQGGGAGG